MTRPFDGIRVLDITHVLAGPFAAYQLGLLGADVIKIEHPYDPDHIRAYGSDEDLNRGGMGTGFLTQGSNKRSVAIDLKTTGGQEILKRMVAKADVLVENYRPGAFAALGLGYEALAAINPRLIYCSMSAFGQEGPRGRETAYDSGIQALSGMMAMTGTPQSAPLKFGTPAIDYATGTMGAFAISSALYLRERTGRGQRIDLAMFDVAMMLMSSHVSAYLRNGYGPKPGGNNDLYATIGGYPTKEGMLMLGASNLRQQRRLWTVLERPDMIKRTNDERAADRTREAALLTEILATRTAAEWELFFNPRHVPAQRVRTMVEAMADPQLETRGVIHRFPSAPGVEGPFGVPLAAFTFAHGGPSIENPPPRLGEHTLPALRDLGYGDAEIAAFKEARVI